MDAMNNFSNLFLVVLMISSSIDAKILVQVDKLENCGNTSDYSMVLKRVGFNLSPDGVQHITADFIITKDMPITSSMQLTMEKCKYKERPDTCERLMPLRTTKGCAIMSSKSHGFASLKSCIKPDFVCPFKKGHYACRNGTVDMNEYRMFPLAGWYWKVRAEAFVSTKRIGCLLYAGMVTEK